MNQLMITKKEIIEELDALPPDALPELRSFIAFLRFKRERYGDQTKKEMWHTALQATYGMWADRDDVADDGVTYVQNIREGHRLNDFLRPTDETD